MQILSDEPDDELVVGCIEAMTREANVVRQILLAIRHPDLRVLSQDWTLLSRGKLGELARATKGVPDVPGIGLVHHVVDGASQQYVLEIRLMTQTVRAAKHRPPGAHE